MKLLIDNDEYGVVYSPGYGAGLWNLSNDKQYLRGERLAVIAVLFQDKEVFKRTQLYKEIGEFELNKFEELTVAWVDTFDEVFVISEIDGYEDVDYGCDDESTSYTCIDMSAYLPEAKE